MQALPTCRTLICNCWNQVLEDKGTENEVRNPVTPVLPMVTSSPVQKAAALSRLTQGCYAGSEQKEIKCLACTATESWFYLLKISPIKIKQNIARLPRRITDGDLGQHSLLLVSSFSLFVPIITFVTQCITLTELLICGVTGLDFNHRETGRKAEAECSAQALWRSALYHTGSCLWTHRAALMQFQVCLHISWNIAAEVGLREINTSKRTCKNTNNP